MTHILLGLAAPRDAVLMVLVCSSGQVPVQDVVVGTGWGARSLGNDAKKSRRGRRRRKPAAGGDGASQDSTGLGNAGFRMECIHEQRLPSSQKAAIDEKGGDRGGEGRGLGVEKAILV